MSDYAKGFKDGFLAGVEEGKKLNQKDYWTQPWPNYLGSPNTCVVCGKDWGNGAWNYYCSNARCPSQAVSYTTVATGAVGSTVTNEIPKGTNGPAGYSGPSAEEEKERLNRYNQVWINGQWAELGG